jgi:acetone carboxylase gamma subunit
MSRRQITEYLAIDLETERWHCRKCDGDLGNARESYKKGLLIRARDPREVHSSGLNEPRFYPDPNWCCLVEMYCPSCATLVEAEYLPPGHPLTDDLQIDIDALKRAGRQEGSQ